MDQNICRLCLKPNNLELDLFADQTTEENVLPKLEAMLKMPLPKVPDWPTMVCVECVQLIRELDNFVDRVRTNQTLIADKMSDMSIKDEESVKEIPAKMIKVERMRTRKMRRQKKNVAVKLADTQAHLEKDNNYESNDKIKIKSEQLEGVSSDEISQSMQECKSKTGRPNRDAAIIAKVMQEMKLFSCGECGREDFDNMRLLRLHFRLVHKIRGYVVCCGKTYHRTHLLHDHIQFHIDKEAFKCEVCGKCFGNGDILSCHAKNQHIAANQRVFECEDCGKGFRRKSIYESHKLKHLGEEARVHKCILCERMFKADRNLKLHIKKMHDSPQSYVCSICGSIFKGRSNLKTHMNTQHDNNWKKEKCDVCGLYFANMKVHKKRKHESEGTVNCEVCRKEVANSFSLKCHMKRHHSNDGTTYPCLICEKIFYLEKKLQEHMSVHTGIKPYVCNFCPATFSNTGNKVKHHRISHFAEWQKWRSERYTNPFGRGSDK